MNIYIVTVLFRIIIFPIKKCSINNASTVYDNSSIKVNKKRVGSCHSTATNESIDYYLFQYIEHILWAQE